MICRECGVDPLHLVAVMHFESSFSPRAMNPSGATGLLQWMPPYPGKHTRDKLVSLGVVGQLPYVRDRYARYKGKTSTLGRAYAVVAAPAPLSLGFDDDEPIYARSLELMQRKVPWEKQVVAGYRQNPAWDPMRHGVVTLRSLGYCARARWGQGASDFYERLTGAKSPWGIIDEWLPKLGYQLNRDGVAAFQRAVKITADGQLGPQTRGAIAWQIAELEGWG